MIEYKQFFFAAPPRTGSTWFIKACSELGLGDGQKAKLHEPPPEDWNGFLVSIVRHPYHWLASYYLALEGGVVGVKDVDQLSWISRNSPTCYEFIENCVVRLPGVVGRIFNSYRASTSMKLEDFPWGPAEFFESLGIDGYRKFDPLHRVKNAVSLTPQNVRKGLPHIPDQRLMKLVRRTERDFCEQYDY